MDDKDKLKTELKTLYESDYESKNFDSLFQGVLSEESANLQTIKRLIRDKKADKLLSDLIDCEDSSGDWRKFQKFCFNLVKTTIEETEFKDVKTEYEVRTKYEALGSSGQRKDIVIANNPRDTSENCIWRKLYTEYDCRTIVFDAKYYENPLDDTCIYQMYAYLDKRSRRLGILLSKKGICNSKAEAAIRRIKQDDYYIMVFSKDEMKLWIDEYRQDGTVKKTFFDKYTRLNTDFAP